MQAKTLEKQLHQFRDSSITYDINQKFAVTEGVKFVVQHCTGEWVVRMYALILDKIEHPAAHSKTHLTMHVHDEFTANVTLVDADNEQLSEFNVKLNESFPLPKLRMQADWDGERWLMFLPSER